MKHVVGLILLGIVLSGCGGSSGSAFVGVTDVSVDESGSISGVSGQSLTVVSTDVGRFAHGVVVGVDATLIGNSAGAVAGDTGNFVAVGIVDGFDVGGAFPNDQSALFGTATYTGRYEMTVVSDYESSANPDDWTIPAPLTGEMTARIELHTAIEAENDPDHGHSHGGLDVIELFVGGEDDVLYFDEVIIYSTNLPARPSFELHDFNGGFANVGSGEPVPLSGQIAFGSEGMIASFKGQTADHLVGGGFGLTGSGFGIAE